MFRDPLHRDPLVIGWAVVMGLALFVALDNNTTWSGDLDGDRVARFVGDALTAFLWLYFLLLFAAWVRARVAGGPGARRPRTRRASGASHVPFTALPWTDRWLRDSRADDVRPHQAASVGEPLQVHCRHGVPLDGPRTGSPVLRALSVSHSIVRPGSSVSVTWCFEHAREVIVDGTGGQPTCGEALVQVDSSRRIDLTARSAGGSTSAATATVVALQVPQLAAQAPPPPVSLRTDVTATVGGATSVTQRLDDFWTTQEQLKPRLNAPAGLVGIPPRLVGVPSSVIRGLRRPRRSTEEV